MLIDYHIGQTSIVLRVKLRNSTSASGAGLTGLTGATAGLVIAAIADNEAATTAYTAAAATIDAIATLGTYAAPSAGHCRFGEVDAVNHKGLVEVQLENSRYAVSGARSLIVSFSGAANLAECDVCIPLRAVDPYSPTFGLAGVALSDAFLDTPMTFRSQVNNTAPTIRDSLGMSWAGVVGPTQANQTNPAETDLLSPTDGTVLYTYAESAGVRLTSDGLDAVIVETGVNARQALAPILAAAAGTLAGAGTGTIVIAGGGVATTRITATTDALGNRTAVTLNLPS